MNAIHTRKNRMTFSVPAPLRNFPCELRNDMFFQALILEMGERCSGVFNCSMCETAFCSQMSFVVGDTKIKLYAE